MGFEGAATHVIDVALASEGTCTAIKAGKDFACGKKDTRCVCDGKIGPNSCRCQYWDKDYYWDPCDDDHKDGWCQDEHASCGLVAQTMTCVCDEGYEEIETGLPWVECKKDGP